MSFKDNIVTNRSMIIYPNLGQPKFLSIETKKFKNLISSDLLLISNLQSEEELRGELIDNIFLIPILDYKLKLKEFLEKEKKEHNFLSRIKYIFKRKKNKEKIETILHKIRPRGYRGDAIKPKIVEIEKKTRSSTSEIEDLDYLSFLPHQLLDDIYLFNRVNFYYRIKIIFSLSEEVLDFFKGRSFVMFDIKGPLNRINYHSIVITKQNWQNFTFLQITDTHLAERNDKIYEIVTKWFRSSIRLGTAKFYKNIKKKIISTIKKSSGEELTRIKKPLRKRLINPNNQLRKFIKLTNREVIKNKVDFVILTGDIIDYAIKTKYKQKTTDINNLELQHSNWGCFKDIILNQKPRKKHKGVIEGEELLCPIFTIIGNHDYRPNHYDLTWGGLYKKMGLNPSEALALNELLSASPISAIIKSKLTLNNYFKEINCLLDFTLKLGDFRFIFLNTGSDSFKNIRDFLTGHPSVTGLKNFQIKFLENLINNKIENNDKNILLTHGPPVNIGKKPYLKERFRKWKQKRYNRNKEKIKNTEILEKNRKKGYNRIDNIFNVKYGTISSNWEKIIDFCKNYTLLTLSGHTHTLKEFKLGTTTNRSKVLSAPPFILKKIENPAAIYYDKYSEKYINPSDIERNIPYILQTPALGLGSFTNPRSAGGYRVIKIKNNYINSFKVKYLK
ncbi:MAG: metallophosphoesterase [Candidatus Lokiarchaeota archaeon]|nr:metallophosphoesterase [Candidatus Lokiarchaeota archaeon]